jgi:type II secretory pathway component PulJ
MWAAMLIGVLARPWARRAAAFALVALTIILFLLNLRRAGERVGRATERLETLERTNAIQRQMLDAAAQRPRNRDDLLDRLRGGGF